MIKIFCVYKITNLINHKSTREAARFLGNENKYRSIALCLSGKTKSSHGYMKNN